MKDLSHAGKRPIKKAIGQWGAGQGILPPQGETSDRDEDSSQMVFLIEFNSAGK